MTELTAEKTKIEIELQTEAKPTKIKKVSKLDFIVNLFKGLPGREGDDTPISPIQLLEDLAEEVKEAEGKGYFRVRSSSTRERDASKYLSEVKWYLTQAAKKGLIERDYKPRASKKKVITMEDVKESAKVVSQTSTVLTLIQ